MTDKMREEYNAWYAKEIGVLGTKQHKEWFKPWEASRKAAAASLKDKAEKEWLGGRGYHSGLVGAALYIEGLPKC